MNLTAVGRELVGLKWSREINENDEEQFMFECKRDEKLNHPVDKNLFWVMVGVNCLVWGTLVFFNLLSMTNLMVISVPLILGAYNLYGFYKCSGERQQIWSDYVNMQTHNAQNHAINYAVNNPELITGQR